MSEPLPSAYIEGVAKRVFPQASNNRFALIDSVKRLLGLAQALTVDEFAFIRSNLNGGDISRDDEWRQLPARLELLSHRLEADGAYVDAGIVHMAFECAVHSGELVAALKQLLVARKDTELMAAAIRAEAAIRKAEGNR